MTQSLQCPACNTTIRLCIHGRLPEECATVICSRARARGNVVVEVPRYDCTACRDRRGYVVNPGAHWVPCKHCRPDGARPGEGPVRVVKPKRGSR